MPKWHERDHREGDDNAKDSHEKSNSIRGKTGEEDPMRRRKAGRKLWGKKNRVDKNARDIFDIVNTAGRKYTMWEALRIRIWQSEKIIEYH
jgi:hypothetical protein